MCETKKVLPEIISLSQSAFTKGRECHGMQETIRGYKRDAIRARCIMKLDIRKAYDLVL